MLNNLTSLKHTYTHPAHFFKGIVHPKMKLTFSLLWEETLSFNEAPKSTNNSKNNPLLSISSHFLTKFSETIQQLCERPKPKLLEIFPSAVKSNLRYLIFRFTIPGIVQVIWATFSGLFCNLVIDRPNLIHFHCMEKNSWISINP